MPREGMSYRRTRFPVAKQNSLRSPLRFYFSLTKPGITKYYSWMTPTCIFIRIYSKSLFNSWNNSLLSVISRLLSQHTAQLLLAHSPDEMTYRSFLLLCEAKAISNPSSTVKFVTTSFQYSARIRYRHNLTARLCCL